MSFQDDEDVFSGGGVKYLSPSRSGPRRTPSRQSMKPRRSNGSLRGGSSLAQAMDDDAANGRHSLAHELAVALMPEPSAGSKMLAEEFGIEYDEGAEGIDEQADAAQDHNGTTLLAELNGHAMNGFDEPQPSLEVEPPLDDLSAHFGSDATPTRPPRQQPIADPMDVLSRDLETTDKFLAHLRHLDAESGPSSAQPSLEKAASDMIRRINETTRDREGQVRELLECEREFKKIAGEIGGNDVLGQLEGLAEFEGSSDKLSSGEAGRPDGGSLDSSHQRPRGHARGFSNDWEMDPNGRLLGDDDEYASEPESPTATKDSFPQPPPISGPATAATAVPHLVHVRTLTTSLASSLAAISEHAQVNGAASADAGRKIRALKNKLGGWRTEWDSAERSRIKIERWEAGLPDDDSASGVGSPPRPGSKRVDGRRVVDEHLRAFEIVLADAGTKTQAIMAKS